MKKKIILSLLTCVLLSSCSGNVLRSFMNDTFFTKNYKSDVTVLTCVLDGDRCIDNRTYANNKLYVEMQTKGLYANYFTSSRELAGNFSYASFSEQYMVVSNFSKWADEEEAYRQSRPLKTTASGNRFLDSSPYRLYIDSNNTPYLMVKLGSTAVLIDNDNAKKMLQELLYIKTIMDEKHNKK